FFRARGFAAGLAAEAALNPWRSQPPFRHEAVCRQPTVERAGSAAIEIVHIPAHNRAKLRDIEISVFELKRIEGPLDQIYPASKTLVAVRELDPAPNADILVFRKNGKGVRVKVRLAWAKGREGQDDPSRHVSVKGGENLPAGLGGNDKDVVRNRFELAIAPDD